MRKEKIHSVHSAKGDTHAALSHAEHAIAQIKAGHYRLEEPHVVEHDLGNGKTFLSFSFVRVDADTSVKAEDPSK